MTWGLALCGGGIRCGAHLGALQVLVEAGWSFDVVAGSSSGAIAGAMYALGLSAEQMQRELTGSPQRVLGYQPTRWGMGNSSRFRRWLRDLVGGARLEELPRRLIVTATDIVHVEPYYFTSGDLAEALYASSALPGLFAPVMLQDRVLADGCLLSPLPVEAVRAAGARRVLGINFQDHAGPVRNLVDVITRSFDTMMAHRANEQAAQADLVLAPPVGQYHIRDARSLPACIQAGAAAARDALAEGWVADPPHTIPPAAALPPAAHDRYSALRAGPSQA